MRTPMKEESSLGTTLRTTGYIIISGSSSKEFGRIIRIQGAKGSGIRVKLKSKVWQRSCQQCLEIYKITRTFPGEERYSLTSQIRKAPVCVPTNIAVRRTKNARPLESSNPTHQLIRRRTLFPYHRGNDLSFITIALLNQW